MKKIKKYLKELYPGEYDRTFKKLREIIRDFNKENSVKAEKNDWFFSEKDIMLICYADHVQESGQKTLKTMHKFLQEFAKDIISRVHFLSFYPYSSDDGFSVIDYYSVNEPYGDWQDLGPISKDFDLMFDCVANHASVKSEWFIKFLAGDPFYKDFFIAFREPIDTSRIFRPRAAPLLTPFKTKLGEKYVWTTFSDDQADLNFSNPEVFLEMVKILLFYVSRGAAAIRLDAVAYAWKKLGTSCFDLPQAHILVKAFREVFNKAAPHVWLITETVLPHKENISYFGNGHDEAHLIYNFQLETLLLHTMLTEDADLAAGQLKKIKPKTKNTNFLNLCVSQDGVHTIPSKGILSKQQVQAIIDDCLNKGGKVLNRDAGKGKTKIYEINITYPSAVGGIEKYLASQAIQLALRGIPLIYFNNLIGADNWSKGVEKPGYSRAINRERFDYKFLVNELRDPNSKKHKIYTGYKKLLKARINEPLFSPLAGQEIITLDPRVMAIKRYKGEKILMALTNVSDQKVKIKAAKLQKIFKAKTVKDIINKQKLTIDSDLVFGPYNTKWLK